MNGCTRALWITSEALKAWIWPAIELIARSAARPRRRGPVGSFADRLQPVAPELERDQQGLLGVHHVARDAEVLRLLERLRDVACIPTICW